MSMYTFRSMLKRFPAGPYLLDWIIPLQYNDSQKDP
jgi:hypothetical protein